MSGKSYKQPIYGSERTLEGEGWQQRASSTVTLLSIEHDKTDVSGVSRCECCCGLD
jgi:hypothetical protein